MDSWLTKKYKTRQNHFDYMDGQGLNQSLTKQNIKCRFKVYRIWPLNLKAMEHRTNPLDIYIQH
jgi:hypothetical protein